MSNTRSKVAALSPFLLLLTNACSLTIQGGAPSASPYQVASLPPERAPATVIVERPAEANPRSSGSVVVVARTAPPPPEMRVGVARPPSSGPSREQLLALEAARHAASDRRAVAAANQRAQQRSRQTDRRAQQLARVDAARGPGQR